MQIWQFIDICWFHSQKLWNANLWLHSLLLGSGAMKRWTNMKGSNVPRTLIHAGVPWCTQRSLAETSGFQIRTIQNHHLPSSLDSRVSNGWQLGCKAFLSWMWMLLSRLEFRQGVEISLSQLKEFTRMISVSCATRSNLCTGLGFGMVMTGNFVRRAEATP